MALFEESDNITVDTLVGEGKKFKTVDDLARGKAESDLVIAAREAELNQLREELRNARTTAELLSNANRTPQSARTAEEITPPAPAPSLTPEDLVARITEVTKNLSVQERQTANKEQVQNRLIEVFGTQDKAEEAIAAKARELDVSIEFLQSTALQSPKAFYTTLGIPDSPVAPKALPTVTHGDVNSNGFGDNRSGPKPGTMAYYTNILNTQGPEAYFHPKIQQQIMKEAFQAAKEGRDFYGT